ncbi:hypothetical protein [Streptomyces sudanensis]|uniref:hypothetical protein n=1 Tax=Streptomyces sudanensis TaxID=436397 RepID=UPI0020CBF0B4|nr:hypothetical protein [Streptomyces sudanensis]MCP9956878.1 hypothetical protein [Streptomyces sudanensis]MCQ0002540.1 hypothetical protein [Streptomyces sudanensis]
MGQFDQGKNSLTFFALGCFALTGGVAVSLLFSRSDGAPILGSAAVVFAAAWILERRAD